MAQFQWIFSIFSLGTASSFLALAQESQKKICTSSLVERRAAFFARDKKNTENAFRNALRKPLERFKR